MIALRFATIADADAIADIYRPAVVEQPISFELEPPTGAQMAERIARIAARTPWLVAAADAAGVVGYAYASPHRERAAYQWSVDVSAYVHPAAQRRGVARALYTALVAMLEVQGFRNAYAGIALPNAASIALHEAMGFRRLGTYEHVGYKLGAWRDVAWLALAIGPYDADPVPPTPIAALRDAPGVAAALAAGQALLGGSLADRGPAR